jgi:hypothetical protein
MRDYLVLSLKPHANERARKKFHHYAFGSPFSVPGDFSHSLHSKEQASQGKPTPDKRTQTPHVISALEPKRINEPNQGRDSTQGPFSVTATMCSK